MPTNTTTARQPVKVPSPTEEALARVSRQYGCGPVQFTGDEHALYERHLVFDNVMDPSAVGPRERFEAVARSVRDVLSQRWVLTEQTYDRENPKRVYYFSIEFLIGRTLGNNVRNLMLDPLVSEAVRQKGLDWVRLLDEEPDAGLGNGGLGRLAACFLDSMATMQVPAMGYGLRYEYGMFRQTLENGWQVERPDNWLRRPDPWEVARLQEKVEIPLNCTFEVRGGVLQPVIGKPSTLIGIPFDRPIVGYGGKTINTLRLWAATAPDSFNFQEFSRGDFVESVAESLAAEVLTRVLYPDDSTARGQALRFVQEYFLVACSLTDIVRRFRRDNEDWAKLPEKIAVQMNDTHPSLAVAELMRLLLDQARLGWDQAWNLTQKSLAYTNHTLLPEALEKWPVHAFEALLPRHLEIIYEINRRLLDDVRGRFPQDGGRLQRVSLIEEGPAKHVRMANLAVVGSRSTNGVSEIHTRLLTTTTLHDLAELFPDRFNNKTNGVTPRRWLLLANPPLASAITDAIGDEWVTDVHQLIRLRPLANDAGFRDAFRSAKRRAKSRFSDWVKGACGQAVDPDSIFDCQVKRIHEYKRQLLNALRIVVLYNRLRANPGLEMRPRTFFFAGKAAPAYHLAKVIIKFINNLAATIDADPVTRGRLKVVFLPRLQREPGRAADPRRRRLQPDFDRRLRGQRHQQHEVHDERGADARHPRRLHHRNGPGGRRGELLPLRPDRPAGRREPRLVQPALALRQRPRNPRGAGPDFLRALQPRGAGHLRHPAHHAPHGRRPLHAPGRPEILHGRQRAPGRAVRQARRVDAQGDPERRRLRRILQRPHHRRVHRRNLGRLPLPGHVTGCGRIPLLRVRRQVSGR